MAVVIGHLDFSAVMLALAKAAAADLPRLTTTDSHSPGAIGHGRARHTNHSQRSRTNRRSAKRAARVRRMRSTK